MKAGLWTKVGGLGALTAGGQLLAVGTLPLYSRIFEPEAYGEYVLFVGAYTVVSVLAGLRYDSAIVLPRRDGQARALSTLVVGLGFAVALIIALLAPGIIALAPLRPGRGASLTFAAALAAATALGSMQRCLVSWCVRRTFFLAMGWAQFAFVLLTVVLQLGFARIIGPLPALLWGYVAALGAQVLLLAVAVRDAWSLDAAGTTWRSIRVLARKYRRFPRYMVGYALASSARDRLVQLAFGLGAGAAVLGRFGLAYRVMFAPNSLIYSAVSPVFYSIASRGRAQAVGTFAAELIEASFVALVMPYVVLAIEAPQLTEATLSVKWHGTGPYLQALAATALLLASTCWIDRAFDSFRRQQVAFALEASFTIISVVLVALLSLHLSSQAVTWSFGLLSLLYYGLYSLAVFTSCGFPVGELRRALLQGLLSVALGLTLGMLVHGLGSPLWKCFGYLFVTGIVIGSWVRLQGGADIIMHLLQSGARGPAARTV